MPYIQLSGIESCPNTSDAAIGRSSVLGAGPIAGLSHVQTTRHRAVSSVQRGPFRA